MLISTNYNRASEKDGGNFLIYKVDKNVCLGGTFD